MVNKNKEDLPVKVKKQKISKTGKTITYEHYFCYKSFVIKAGQDTVEKLLFTSKEKGSFSTEFVDITEIEVVSVFQMYAEYSAFYKIEAEKSEKIKLEKEKLEAEKKEKERIKRNNALKHNFIFGKALADYSEIDGLKLLFTTDTEYGGYYNNLNYTHIEYAVGLLSYLGFIQTEGSSIRNVDSFEFLKIKDAFLFKLDDAFINNDFDITDVGEYTEHLYIITDSNYKPLIKVYVKHMKGADFHGMPTIEFNWGLFLDIKIEKI